MRQRTLLRLPLTLAVVASVLASAVPAQGQAQGSRDSTDRVALEGLQQDWSTAIVKRDTAFFVRTLADDFESGQTTKARLIASVRDSTRVVMERSTTRDVRIRLFGETAIVTGVATGEGRRAGQPFSEAARFLRVFVKRNAGWEAVAGLATIVTP